MAWVDKGKRKNQAKIKLDKKSEEKRSPRNKRGS